MEPERRELLDRWKLTYDPAVRYAWQKLDEIRNLCLNEIATKEEGFCLRLPGFSCILHVKGFARCPVVNPPFSPKRPVNLELKREEHSSYALCTCCMIYSGQGALHCISPSALEVCHPDRRPR